MLSVLAPQINLIGRVAIGVMLVSAGAAKLPDLKGFHAVVDSYHVMPRGLAVALGPLLPLIEVSLGISLLLARSPFWPALLCVGLFSAFGAAAAINLARRRDISCGCFGLALKSRLKWSLVARNIAFGGLSLIVMQSGTASATHQILPVRSYFPSILSGVGVVAMVWLWDAMTVIASGARRPGMEEL